MANPHAYNNAALCTSLEPQDAFTCFDATDDIHSAAAGAFQRCVLAFKEAASQPSIRVEIKFSGVPGAFEFDVQEASTDSDAYYSTVPVGGALTVVNADGTNIATTDLIGVSGPFFRLLQKTATANAVTAVGRIIRTA